MFSMKILFIGDTYGDPGRKAVEIFVTRMKQNGEVDFVVCNAENTADGSGITKEFLEMDLVSSNAKVSKSA